MTEAHAGYARELELATETALQAGHLLREEFHHAGGPRGTSHDHAPADNDAEALIRAALHEAFPDYAYLGEETGSAPGSAASGGHTWVVDPNDGTSSFLKGFRGPAVSIALLREGRPVLGVVYAYCCPDDRGDLFAWAEGCGPLRRNGREIQRQWPTAPGPECTALVSQSADKCSLANALAVHPMRLRAVPSIAYRLALVAAGEADLGVSLSGPCGWDYAAGHALLLGAGGDLYDAGGRPITYSADGRSHCGGNCFGGPPEIVADAVTRKWDKVFQHHHAEPERLHLCRPAPGRTEPNAGVLSRAQGCLLGQFAGDALGGLVEFQSASRIAASHPHGVRLLADGGTWRTLAGQPTDDSEMALALARSIVASGGYDAEAAAQAYAWWVDSRPFDIGGTIAAALRPASAAMRSGQPVAEAARHAAAGVSSQANGALMRVSPIGIAAAHRPVGTAAEWARADAALTHADPVCQDANTVFADALAFAIREGAAPAEVHAHAVAAAADMLAAEPVQERLALARTATPADFSDKGGWVLLALQNAFYQLLHAPSLEEGVVDTVMRGGDTDTNAAIAGALLGAVHGREAIPQQWMDRVLVCRPIAGLPDVKHPRPQAFWPVDALWLAERLLTAH